MKQIILPNYSEKEERLNASTHGIGAFFSMIGLILLVQKSMNHKALICSLFFSISLFIMYLSSSIYHGLKKQNTWKKWFRLMDHCNVFLLEISTFIPVCFIVLEKNIGQVYFLILMILTIIGIILNYLILDKVQMISVILHLITGWSIIFFIPELLKKLGPSGTIFLFLGGTIYTIGSILYRLGRNYRYMHSVFHIFCLLASFCHFIMIYRYIL